MNDWAIAIPPLIGVVLGASLRFWFNRTASQEQQLQNLRAQAYSDYLRAVAASAHLRSDEDLRDADRDAADAKARIAVYGTSPVIQALADFEKAGAVLSKGPAAKAFVAMVSRMRSEKDRVATKDLEMLLLGTVDAED